MVSLLLFILLGEMASVVAKARMQMSESCHPPSKPMAPVCPVLPARGFTLIEILVVLVIIGLIAGVALPRLLLISERFELAAQRSSALSALSGLGYRAYSSGKPIELTGSLDAANPTSAVDLPAGWRIETPAPIRYSFTGICGGGTLTLFGPAAYREAFVLAAPNCKPVPTGGVL